jgi:hypothetical protein
VEALSRRHRLCYVTAAVLALMQQVVSSAVHASLKLKLISVVAADSVLDQLLASSVGVT